ncbi:MAG TPA: hypothetical protein DCO71_02685 [Gammaproteobacteria bacterium]|nr:hypothetical protein [Gammaproteobacteria bacterium]
MIPFSLPAFIKFLLGVFLLQGATALLVMAVQDAGLHRSGWLVVALGILIGVIAALWFSAIASHASQHSYVRASEKFNRQRDRIRRQADKEKTKEIRDGHQQVMRETRRQRNRSTLKFGGAALAGIAGLGVLLLFTQFITLGLLAVSATGGALLGYGVRARQYPAIGQQADNTADSFPGKPLDQGRLLADEKVIRTHKPE